MEIQPSFNRLIKQKQWFKSGQPVVVAVSTGVDSMVLLTLLEQLPNNLKPKIIVAYIDHQLREQSKLETEFLKAYCNGHDLILEMDMWSKSEHPKVGIEASARDFRYRFFETIMQKHQAKVLLTAHHANDLAESVLMKLIRGGRLSQLVGIRQTRPFANGELIRPLLSFSKADLLTFAKHEHLKWFEDATNQELDVFRNRVRHLVMPRLQAENPQLLDHINEYANQIAENQLVDSELLQPVVNSLIVDNQFDLDKLKTYSKLTQAKIIEFYLENNLQVKSINRSQIKQIIQLVNNLHKPQGYLKIEGFKITKAYNRLEFIKNANYSQNNVKKSAEFMVVLNKWFLTLNDSYMQISKASDEAPNSLWLLAEDFPLKVRTANVNDKLQLKNGHQSIKRALINAKVPNDERKNVQLLTNVNGEILAIIGIKNAYRPFNSTAQAYILKLNNSIMEGNINE